MTITTEEHDHTKVLRLAGELTGGEKSELLETVTDLLGARGTGVVLDLAQVTYMNSAGLGELVRLAAQANIRECRLILTSPSAYLAGVFEMTKLDRFFEIKPDVADALRTLAPQAPAKP